MSLSRPRPPRCARVDTVAVQTILTQWTGAELLLSTAWLLPSLQPSTTMRAPSHPALLSPGPRPSGSPGCIPRAVLLLLLLCLGPAVLLAGEQLGKTAVAGLLDSGPGWLLSPPVSGFSSALCPLLLLSSICTVGGLSIMA